MFIGFLCNLCIIRRLGLKKKKLLLISFLGMIFFVLPLSATVVLKMSMEDITTSSEEIIQGKVKEITSQWNEEKTLIYSEIKIEVKEVIKGENKRKEIVIRQLGGKVGDLRLKVIGMPVFQEEEEVILFLKKDKKQLKKFYVNGLFQGKFAIKKEKVERKSMPVRQFIGDIKHIIKKIGGGKK